MKQEYSRLKRIIQSLNESISSSTSNLNTDLGAVKSKVRILEERPAGGDFSGTMDDIDDGATYVKTENNYTDEEKTKLAGLSETSGLTQAQILARTLGC